MFYNVLIGKYNFLISQCKVLKMLQESNLG